MIFFKFLIFITFVCFSNIALADNHDKKKELVEAAKEVVNEIEEILDDEEVPLNDPFAGNEGGNSAANNIPEGESEDDMSLYNFKLTGLISGKDHSYISLTSSGGDVFRFLDMSTKALELETGVATNEPVNYAIRTTIEHAVHNMIYEGIDCEFWSFKIEE